MAWQVASSASLVVSYAVALRFSAALAHRFGQQAPLNRFIAMFVLYAGTSLAIWLVVSRRRRLHRPSAAERIRPPDGRPVRSGQRGAAVRGDHLLRRHPFGKARAAVLKSRSGYYIAVLLDRADGVMPRELHEVWTPT